MWRASVAWDGRLTVWDDRDMAPVEIMLTSRRHVDLLRVATAACRS